MNRELTREDFADDSVRFEISKTLLHDVILMEVRSYTMKYQAGEKRKEKKRPRRLVMRLTAYKIPLMKKI